MMESRVLLPDLQKLVKELERDLKERFTEYPTVDAALKEGHRKAEGAGRTAASFEEWRSDAMTQLAAAWVLGCVFVRFLEDNGLIRPRRLAGPGEELHLAREHHEQYFREHPEQSDREYLLATFKEIARLPGGSQFFGEHNPIHEHPEWLSGDGASALVKFFQRIEPETGHLALDFTDEEWDTRFLGDLYQDLSEHARKKYALLQTPRFVERFILDRTLDPAVDEFGLSGFRMIDPACGSGHFLLGAFERLLKRRQKAEPATGTRVLVQRALDSIHGVDLNPFAVAIARFRLLLVAMKACGAARLKDAPDFKVNVVCGDSLLHGAKGQKLLDLYPMAHAYYTEDLAELERILEPGRYHAVVANPPYITAKDRALNLAYRERYKTCRGKYSLVVPFMERIFALAAENGYTGQITANSFMKREFGKELIEKYLPTVDLTHVIDTSGAYIPGHGTPTVILFGRKRASVAGTIRTVLGIRGEPSTPEDAATGLVWSAILRQIDAPGSESDFVSVTDSPRERFATHPWSIGGGGAAELKVALDERRDSALSNCIDVAGVFGITAADEVMIAPQGAFGRHRVEDRFIRPLTFGDVVRDWALRPADFVVFPYQDERLVQLNEMPGACRWLWPCRTVLGNRATFSRLTYFSEGRPWWEWHQVALERQRAILTITFAFVATHNHFVLDRGGKVFGRTAPVIKLPPEATEDDHLGLLGLLNSSTGCFWMKQVSHNKGSTVDAAGARQRTTPFEDFWEHDGTKLREFPLIADRPIALARVLDSLAADLAHHSPRAVVARWSDSSTHLRDALAANDRTTQDTRESMIFHQEELDWWCYVRYAITPEDLTYSGDPVPVMLGARAFELILARDIESGETETTWFERHRSTPTTEPPAVWPEAYRRLVTRRIDAISAIKDLRLIEQPEYKRRWSLDPWPAQVQTALRSWLLSRLESYFDFDGRMNDAKTPTARLTLPKAVISVARLADVAAKDEKFMEAAEVYRARPDFDVLKLVDELVQEESVPLLSVLRYKETGLEKRRVWERTWDLQRDEDRIDARSKLPRTDPRYLTATGLLEEKKRLGLDKIPVPPRYASSDFLKTSYWRLRGKLDVPKERWVSFPGCEGPDGSLPVAWAGLDHLELATAASGYYVDIKERLGGSGDPRLEPLLCAILELVPWLKQWRNELDEHGNRMGDFFESFVNSEARALGRTSETVRSYKPARVPRGRRKTRNGAAPAPPAPPASPSEGERDREEPQS